MEPDKKAATKVLRTWFGGAFSGDHVLASNMVDAAYKVEDEPPLNLDYKAALNHIDIVTATGHNQE